MTSAFFELATAAKPWLAKAGASGRMIGVSSFVAHAFARGIMSFPASAAAKAGMEALAKALAADLAPSGVTVNCVAPGFIEKDAAGHTVNRSESIAWIGGCTDTNEFNYLVVKTMRSLGVVCLENQARV